MAKSVGAPKGNKRGVKLKRPDIRQEAYIQYCDWIAQGMPKKAWSFEHSEFTCCYRTMDKYIVDNPSEFPPITKEIAHCKGYRHWINEGKKMMIGEYKTCQPALYQMFMRNMFDWDKEKKSPESEAQPLVKVLIEEWKK